MTIERWRRVETLFHAAGQQPPEERAAFLRGACGADDELRREVESLLAQPASSSAFPKQPEVDDSPHASSPDATRSAMTGRRIGVYELQALLGVGGMGEVYRARDTKLGRDVAIKFLPASLTADPERLWRFEREARVLASLNHPNIATIHGLEEADGLRGIVMELVDGETLAARLGRGRLSIDDALVIARQVADALECAHEKGIVHRDLKPANITLTRSGAVKVLDFGLAKAMAGDMPDAAHSPTAMTRGTRDGVVLGTPAYMSPEQARGQDVDKRTDIWAFGCVLYEMLTGTAPFRGTSITDTLVAVVEREPAWDLLPTQTPSSVRRLLQRCLVKDHRRRLRDIGDASVELDSDSEQSRDDAVLHTRTSNKVGLLAAAATCVAMLAGVVWFGVRASDSSRASSASPTVARFTVGIDAPDWLGLDRQTLAWSPDGSRLVYLERNDSGTRLYSRAMDQADGRFISGTDTGVAPFVSPDGQRLGFFVAGKLRTVSIEGGTPLDVCDVQDIPLGATWTTGGALVLGSIGGNGLLQVPSTGGEPRPVGASDGPEAWPEALPDGKSVLYTRMADKGRPATVSVVSLSTGERRTLFEGSVARYLDSGHLVYMQGGSLMAVGFDARRLDVIGKPVKLLDDVHQAEGAGAAQFAVSGSGNLAYVSHVARSAHRQLVMVDRNGRAQPLATSAPAYDSPRVSPDGQRIVAGAQDQRGRNIWVFDVLRAVWSQLTFDNGEAAIWTPDGTRITYISERNGARRLYWKAADGSGAAELLSPVSGNPHSWSPDGRLLARTGAPQGPIGSGSQVLVLSMDASRETRPFLANREGTEMAAPAIHPSGRWIAYVANDSGKRQVYVRPFPTGDARYLVSTAGGTQPMWSRDGHELFYREGDKMLAVAISTTPGFRAGAPTVLFEGNFEAPAVRADYDLMPDGQHFVMVKADAESTTSRRLNVVFNWGEELQRRKATSGQ